METPEIMTLEEVAKYLRVSERTVLEWVQKGEIPGGRLGTSWRFKRADVERWVDARLRAERQREREPSPQAIVLSRVLTTERVILGSFARKQDALDALIDLLARALGTKDRRRLADAIQKREAMMSTGIGMGIGVPHVSLPEVAEVTLAALLSRQDISDYESLDGQPVRVVFMILSNPDQRASYLRVLSAISAQIRNPGLREALWASPDAESFCRTLIQGVG